MRLHLTRRCLLCVLAFGWLGCFASPAPTKTVAPKIPGQTRLTETTYHYDASPRSRPHARPPFCYVYVYDAQGKPPSGYQPMDGSAFRS